MYSTFNKQTKKMSCSLVYNFNFAGNILCIGFGYEAPWLLYSVADPYAGGLVGSGSDKYRQIGSGFYSFLLDQSYNTSILFMINYFDPNADFIGSSLDLILWCKRGFILDLHQILKFRILN